MCTRGTQPCARGFLFCYYIVYIDLIAVPRLLQVVYGFILLGGGYCGGTEHVETCPIHSCNGCDGQIERPGRLSVGIRSPTLGSFGRLKTSREDSNMHLARNWKGLGGKSPVSLG